MRVLFTASLLVSLMLYIAQIFLYTEDQEILVYGVFGTLWFLALHLNAFSTQARTSAMGIFLLSGLAAFGLGFIPHRLRLGPGFDIYMFLFPVIHFLATFTFLSVRRNAEREQG